MRISAIAAITKLSFIFAACFSLLLMLVTTTIGTQYGGSFRRDNADGFRNRPQTSSQGFGSDRKTAVEKIKFEMSQKRQLSSSGSLYGGMMNADCSDRNLTGYACVNYLNNYLEGLVTKNQSYNTNMYPVTAGYSGTIDIELLISFANLLSVDMVGGSMSMAIYVDMFWTDEIVGGWDEAKCDNVEFITVPSGLLWISDVQLYNAIGGFFNKLDSVTVALLSSGVVWWSAKGVVSFDCNYEVEKFPFDSQHCSAQFASWSYTADQLNISSAEAVVFDGFDNPSWRFDSVTVSSANVPIYGVYWSFGMYDISISRHPNHYVTFFVLPATIITTIVLCGLFMAEQPTRISLCVTGFLTITAIQWSMSAQVPVTDKTTWLSEYLIMNMLFIALVAAETFVSIVLTRQKNQNDVPPWVVKLVRLSLLQFYEPPPIQSSSHERDRASMPQSNINNSNNSNNPLVVASSVSTPSTSHSTEKENLPNAVEMINMAANISSALEVKDENQPDHKTKAGSRASTVDFSTCTWKRAANALDRICRVVIPLIYVLTLSIMIGTAAS
jgi:hypothetical protein